MKILILLSLMVATAKAERKPSSQVPEDTIKRLMNLYPGQGENVIHERLQNTKSTFEKWRAFPPYFYDVVRRSPDMVGKYFDPSRLGMCAGDAHLENFGFLYLNKPQFSINDLDDSSICSLDADALRLFVGHRLVTKVSAADWIQSYKNGMAKKIQKYPAYIKSLEDESLKKKKELSKKYRKLLESKTCAGDFSPVTDREKTFLVNYLLGTEKKDLNFVCARTKETGGSAGLKRYVLFYDIKSGKEVTQEAIELKPLGTPAPLAPNSMTLLERQALYGRSVDSFLGPGFKAVYFPITLDGKAYLRRPLWGGNVGVSLEDMSSTDIPATALYQAQILGAYHSSSGKPFNINASDWENMATKFEQKWRQEMGE